jgi:hypothetical protein
MSHHVPHEGHQLGCLWVTTTCEAQAIHALCRTDKDVQEGERLWLTQGLGYVENARVRQQHGQGKQLPGGCTAWSL